MRFSFYVILTILLTELIKCEDRNINEYKYLRNKKFNDTYLDLFFKTTPTGLPSNWLFADENFIYKRNYELEIIPINRTKLSRSTYFAFEGVPIYKIKDGNVDLSKFTNLSNLFYIEQERADSSRYPTISDFSNIISDTNLRKGSANLNIGAGNQLANAAGYFYTSHKYFKYFISGSFINSPGAIISDKIDSRLITDLNYLRNSDFSQGNVFCKIYFDNNTSQVGINVFFLSGKKSIPPIRDSLYKFMNYPLYNNLILNFDFNTKFDEGIILSGNFFYNNYLSKRSIFDDSTYKTQDLFNSFNETGYGYNYGSILALKTNFNDIAPTNNISIAYTRDIANENIKKLNLQKRFETENLQISIRQPLFFHKLSIFPTFRYTIKKPLYSSDGTQGNTLKGVDYRIDINYLISKNLVFFNSYSRENIAPPNFAIFIHDAKFETENHINFGFKLNTPDYELSTKLFYSELENILENFSMNLSKKHNDINSKGVDFNLKIYSDFGYILINYTYNDLNKVVDFPTKPKHIGEIKIYNTYNIGLRWMFEAEYYSNEFILTDNLNNLGTKNLFIMNFRAGYKVLNQNEIFVGIYNFLNSKYFVYGDLPGTGINFFLGIHIHI